MTEGIVPDYDWHPNLKCAPHGMPLALCMDGQYRCEWCTGDRLLRLSFMRKDSS